MNVIYILDKKTQKGYPLEIHGNSYEALNRKDVLQLENPNHIFYHRVNDTPQELYNLEEILSLLNEE